MILDLKDFIKLTFLFFAITAIFAQQSPIGGLNFRNFTRFSDGLSRNDIRAITADHDGKIWIATAVGIDFFDGFLENVFVFGDRELTDLIITKRRQYWVSSELGIGIFDPNAHQLDIHYDSENGLSGDHIFALFERKNGEILAATENGVDLFDGFDWRSLSELETRSIFETADGTLWLGHTNGSVTKIETNGLVFNFGKDDGITGDRILSFCENMVGEIWVGSEKGISVYDGVQWENRLTSEVIYALRADRDGTIWAGTDRGIFLIADDQVTNLTRQSGLTSDKIRIFFEAIDGGIWIGTADNGISFSDRSWLHKRTDQTNVNFIKTDQKDRTWIGTANALYQLDQNSGELESRIENFNVRDITEDRNGDLWTATQSGIYRLENGEWRSEKIFADTNDIQAIESVNGEFWIATGIVLTGDSFGILPNLYRFDGDQFHREMQLNRVITEIFFDQITQRLYLATVGNNRFSSEILALDLASGKIENFNEMIIGQIFAIERSENGEIWIGTSNGVHIFASDQLAILDHLTTDDGLIDNNVNAIHRDWIGRMFVATTDGVVIFFGGKITRTLTASDGLISNEITAIASSGEDLFWFGGADGSLSRFTPERSPPRTRFVEGPINGEIIGDPTIAFKFEGGDASSDLIRYRYNLDNDTEWKWTDRDGLSDQIFLSKLSDGKHQLRVQSIDIEGNIDPIGAIAEFVVDTTPPIATITAPSSGAIVKIPFEIVGTVGDLSDFSHAEIEIIGTSIRKKILNEIENNLIHSIKDPLNDREYQIRLRAFDQKNSEFDRQHSTETIIDLIIDNTPPKLKIVRPIADQTVSSDFEIAVEIEDQNFENYRIEFREFETWQIASDLVTQNITNVKIDGVHGEISLRTVGKDLAGNVGVSPEVRLKIDQPNALPIAELQKFDRPISETVSIIGTAKIGENSNATMREVIIDYREINRSEWKIIRSVNATFADELIALWETSHLADGNYLLRLRAIDSKFYQSDQKIEVVIDNTPPKIEIDYPISGSVLRPPNTPIIGTANDQHFDNFTLEFFNETENQTDTIARENTPKVRDLLGIWLTTDLKAGRYFLKLSAIDTAKNSSETSPIEIFIDTDDVIAEITFPKNGDLLPNRFSVRGTAIDQNFASAQLEFRKIDAPSNWQKIVIETPTLPKFDDDLAEFQNMIDGDYEIRLIATDNSGRSQSHQITVTIDNSPPIAKILTPQTDQQVSQQIVLIGTATDKHFKNYSIDFGKGRSPNFWQPITKTAFLSAISENVLAEWTAPSLEGIYTMRLTVEDRVGLTQTDQIAIHFNPPIRPNESGLISFDDRDGRVSLHIPPNSLTDRTIITIDRWANSDHFACEISPTHLQLRKPAVIEFSLIEIDFRNLRIYRLEAQNWNLIGGKISDGKISTTISKLGIFAIMPSFDEIDRTEKFSISEITSQPRVFAPKNGERTAISFTLNRGAKIEIEIYDVSGRRRRNFPPRIFPKGRQIIWWDGRDDRGNFVPSDFYLISVRGQNAKNQIVVVVKNR